MIIHKYTHETDGAMARVTAEVRWEKSDRRSRRLFYETDIRFADDIKSNPNAWLLASVIPAMQHGEERVLVEGQVCPQIQIGRAHV